LARSHHPMTNSLMDLGDMVVGYLSKLQTLWLHHIFWFHVSSQEQLLISMPPKALEISGVHYSTRIYRPLLLSPWKWFMRTGYLSLISGRWPSSKCHRPSSQWLLGHSLTLTHELGYLYTHEQQFLYQSLSIVIQLCNVIFCFTASLYAYLNISCNV